VTDRVIDLNADVGESFGAYRIGADEDLIPLVTSVNVAGGLHGGDPRTIARTVALADEHGVAVGAHPGYPDLAGFGRRAMDMSDEDLAATVRYQLGAVAAFAPGHRLQHVKAHGAMYNRAVADTGFAGTLVHAIRAYDPALIHVVLAGSAWESVAREARVRFAREAFADRALLPDGRLVPRGEPGAVIHDPDTVARRAVSIAIDGRARAVDGSQVPVAADTICIHGDTPGAAALARAVRAALEGAGVTIRPMGASIP
jgi:UPF0271 protein